MSEDLGERYNLPDRFWLEFERRVKEAGDISVEQVFDIAGEVLDQFIGPQ